MLNRAMLAESAAGEAFGDQHGRFYRDEEVMRIIFAPIEAHVTKNYRKGPIRVADLGCGSGLVGLYGEKRLQELGYNPQVIFVDSNQKMLNAIEPAGNRKVVLADLAHLHKSSIEPVDVAFGRHFIHYVPPEVQRAILREISAIVRDRGMFVNSTGSHEDPEVGAFMAQYLSEVISLRDPEQPVQRFYQTVQTYFDWMLESGFHSPEICGSYVQKFVSTDYYERFGFSGTVYSPESLETTCNELLGRLNPADKIIKALDIKRWEDHHSVSLPARVFTAKK